MADLQAPEVTDPILERARSYMEEAGVDVLLAMSPENVSWVSGVSPPSQRIVRSRHAICVIPRIGQTTFVAVALEGGLVRTCSRLDAVLTYQEFVEHPLEVVANVLKEGGLADGRVGIEATFLPVADHQVLVRELPHVRLVPVDEAFSTLRMIKTPAEFEAIRAIGRVAETIQLEVAARFGAGAREDEIGRFIAERYGEEGGDALTMLVVGSGERSAHVNAPPTTRVLGPGEILRTDVIGVADRYYSDVARTMIAGDPDDEQRRVFALLYDVHRRVLEAIRPGALTSDIYRIYHERMQEANLPPYHFVGHGLGVTLHEEPFVDAIHSIPLEPGMVLCIEPLTLIDGQFGVQIEDEVLVTADGHELLTEAGPALLQLAGA